MKRYKVLLVILLLLLLLCLGYICYILYRYHQADMAYDALIDDYVIVHNVPDDDIMDEESGNTCPVPIPDRDIDIEGLLSRNPDFVGWLYYGDGGVDYPVVKEHEDDINGYLHRTFDGEPSSSGCIFISYDAADDFKDLNTFLYGHNMKNGSMFGSLKQVFRNPSDKFTDPYFYIWTKDHECIAYRIVSMCVVDKDSSVFAIPTDKASYETYLGSVLIAGRIDSLVPFTEFEEDTMNNTSPIVTISACYGAAGTRNRLLIHGVEIYRGAYNQ